METVRRGIAARSMAETPTFADGGVVSPFTIRGVLNSAKKLFEPESETMTSKYARQDAAFIAKHPKYFPSGKVPVTQTEDQKAITQYASGNRLDERMKAQGLKDGGPVKAGIIRGPGTGISDSIKGTMTPGSFVMPKDSTDVMVSNGETHFTPEMVQKVGAMALMAMKDATHTPVAEQKPGNYFDDGGIVGEKKKNSYGDAAAASQSSAVSQIPTSGYSPAPAKSVVNNPAPLDAQTASDRASVGAAVDTFKDANSRAGAAIADVATMIPRGIVGAYDSAVVRPMRAAGISAGYLSPLLTPTGANPSSPTPFYDRIAAQDSAKPAPGYGINQPKADPITQSVPPASTSVTPIAAGISQAGAGRGYVNQQPVTPSAPPEAPQLNNKVVRDGNSYTGAPNISGDVSFIDPKGKALSSSVSPQSYPAPQVMDAGQAAAPAIEKGGVNHGDGSGNVGLGYAANLARKNAETGASSIFNTGSRQTARDQLKSMDAQELAGINTNSAQNIAKLQGDNSLARERINADTQRVGYGITAQNNQANQQNAAARLGIDRTTAGLANQQTTQQIGAAKQMQDLQARIINAKTPEEKAAAEDALTVITGKQRYEKNNDKRYMKLSSKDGTTGDVAERLFDTETQQYVGETKKQAYAPTPDSIAFLKSNPKFADKYDAMYGAGSAVKVLGQK